jgi:hypothetical protein
LPFINSLAINCLLSRDPVGAGLFTIDSNGGFWTNNGANGASGAAFSDQCCGVVPFGSDVISSEAQYLLWTGSHAQFTALAIDFIDFDSTLWGHSYLL